MGHEVDEADGGVHGGRIEGILLRGLEQGEVQAHVLNGGSDDRSSMPELRPVVSGGMGIENDFHLVFLDSVDAGEGERHLGHGHDLPPDDDVGVFGVVDENHSRGAKEGVLDGLGDGRLHKGKESVVVKCLDGDSNRLSEAHLPGGGNLGKPVEVEEVVPAP